MAAFLLVRLYGPLCSWGGPAVGELRPTGDLPTRSAVLGLVGACLGVRRDDAEGQAALVGGYAVAVRVDASGRRRDDFHTVQAPRARAGLPPATRREELAGPSERLETMITRRSYREDAAYTVAVFARAAARWPLDAVAGAMRRPVFHPVLGRKSCPPSLPLVPLLSEAADLPTALAEADAAWKACPFLSDFVTFGSRTVVWDEDIPAGALANHASAAWRRDQPSDRGRWQFVERRELSFVGEGG